MPTHCPLCGTKIVKPEGEAMHRCPNRACPSRGLETLISWTGVADIDGVGEQTIRVLWEQGLVRSLPELYRLTKEQLFELEGFAEISANAAIESIERSKQVPFSRVLLGLNIPGIGWVLARLGAVRPQAQRDHLLRCRVPGVHPRKRAATIDL